MASADQVPPSKLALARLEAMEPINLLEGARVTSSPFSTARLKAEGGHKADFLEDGVPTPLPSPVAGSDDAKAADNDLVRWLHYRHFSILFDARKKQALLAVVDIDGRNWKSIKRRTGDIWYHDPRVSIEDQPQARHFSKPDPLIDPEKNHFAFGHLVRRMDPCWPDDTSDVASEAELQTFYLTNASPQAEDLNEGIWNNLEDLVLNDLTKRLKIRAVVMSGPVFDGEKRALIHGEMPVPSQYFKIVAWKSQGRMMSVGWVQHQPESVMPPIQESGLPFEEPDGKGKKNKKKPSLMWLTPISKIAEMTNLDLSDYEAGDTYGLRKPKVGPESMSAAAGPVPLNADDLLLTKTLPLDDNKEASAAG